MAYNNNPYGGYNKYREVGVKTASQGQLVVMLYNGAVSHLETAMALLGDDGNIEAKNIESFGANLQKVQAIISELEVSLDMEKGGEIAKNLMALYIYFNKEILDATINHDKKKLQFVHKQLSELRDSWVVAANSTANTQVMPADRPAVNITG